MSDLSWTHKEIVHPTHDINIFHINAEQIPEIYAAYGDSLFKDRYNIGFWHWELPDFPDKWVNSFRYVDEIWVPSTFVGDSIAIKSPVPVLKIPHAIEVKIDNVRDRAFYKLPENVFLFYTMYDLNSVQERKNPRASIEAFKKAFKPNELHVGLVIKVNGSHSAHKQSELDHIIGGYSNIFTINETLSRNDVNALMNVVDCFISLHRSEGFGLGFAEAMYLGKPVIGTNWSSNTDFMNPSNSCLVDYRLVQLQQDYGPYESYQYWADPDVNHASQLMIKLVQNKDFCRKVASEGEAYIKKYHSPVEIGKKIQTRLDYIYQWKYGG